MTKEYIIDGSRVVDLASFYNAFEEAVDLAPWGRNLDAFNDVLRGGFGTPPEGFVLRWRNAAGAQQRLGHAETARQLRFRLERCHPTNYEQVEHDLQAAEAGRGPTVFDWLVEIIRDHGPGGTQSRDNVVLLLE